MTAIDPRVENLQLFVVSLDAAIARMRERGPVLASIVTGYEELDGAAHEVLDAGAPVSFEDALETMASSIDDAEESAPADCARVSGTAVPDAKAALLTLGGQARDEAEEFAMLAGTLVSRMETAQAGVETGATSLNKAGADLTAQLVVVREHVTGAAVAAKALAGTIEKGLVASLTEASAGTFAVTDQAQETVQSVVIASNAASKTVEPSLTAMVASHEELREGMEETYSAHQTGSDTSVTELTGLIVAELGEQEKALDLCRAATAGDDGAVAVYQVALGDARVEVGDWRAQVAEEAEATANLQGLAASVRVALQITANVDGVLDTIGRSL